MSVLSLSAGWRMAATLLAPALRLHLTRRAKRGKEIGQRLGERRGIDPTLRPRGTLLWIHAASVGETLSILPVLPLLRDHARVLLTTGTVTSQTLLQERIAQQGLTGFVLNRFAPLDVPAWADRFLSHWKPDAACFIESELWPNQIAACRTRRIPLMLVNARMSDRSFRTWSYAPNLAREVLGSFSRIQARSEQDADRLCRLGATRVDSPGDLKFAAPPLPVDQAEFDRVKALLAARPVWLAASTHPGEEMLIAAAHKMIAVTHPDVLTIIVPRHPDRGRDLARQLDARLRTEGDPLPTDGIWIADTMGEMGLWYRLVPIAFVGRSLVPPGGGQNPLEPARLGCVIAVGPYAGNFTDHIALLREAGSLVETADPAGLAHFVRAMLNDPVRRGRMGQQASAVVLRHQDLPARTAQALLALLPVA